MKAKIFLYPMSAIVVLALLTGCSHFALGTRSDAQIASDVQSKISGDANVPNKQIGVTSDNGVVTLSGTANSDMERTAAANDAGQVQGVKTVVNNIQVLSAANQPPVTPMSDNPAASVNPPADTTSSNPGTSPTRLRHRSPSKPRPDSAYTDTSNSGSSTANTTNTASTSAPAYTPPPPPQPVTVAEGTMLAVSLIDPLSSESNKTGETFRASLETPLVGDDGRVAVPAGADVEGRIVDAKPSTHFSGSSNLALELTRITVGGKSYDIATNQWAKKGAGRGTRSAETIGGGAAVGALIGGLIGGGKGAAIGAGAGGAAGTGVQAATHGEAIKLPSETRLDFRLASPVTVTPVASTRRQPVQ
jgi:BON domain